MTTLLDLYGQHAFWAWMGLAAALLGIEILTGSGWLLWASASAAVVGVIALTGLPLAPTLLVYAAITIVSTLAARRYLPRSVVGQGADINDNVGRLIGRRAAAVGVFEGRSGRVFIDGKEWAAELDGGERLKAGAEVEVVGVDGARLKVRPA
ncbi:NfeD family protein [Phenylobacterium sp.]|jgi:membrane protein implicated in regulation of membrane protease activity|uniref:NfeD family protein n=1 Tax=Phenylobacterium sp. TaxID=1871053 RepID=UPI002F927E98